MQNVDMPVNPPIAVKPEDDLFEYPIKHPELLQSFHNLNKQAPSKESNIDFARFLLEKANLLAA